MGLIPGVRSRFKGWRWRLWHSPAAAYSPANWRATAASQSPCYAKRRKKLRVRLDAVTEMRALLESSPVGLITVDSGGKIGMANAAASNLLGFTSGSPEGEPIENYIPVLDRFLRSPQGLSLMQTKVEASGRRRTGETFLSQAWVTSYDDTAGRRLAVVLSDATELIRDREESGLKQLLTNSRIVAGAVSHELRNLAAAGSVVYHNLRQHTNSTDSKDFQALGTVLESILRLSSTDLADASEEVLEGVDVGELAAGTAGDYFAVTGSGRREIRLGDRRIAAADSRQPFGSPAGFSESDQE